MRLHIMVYISAAALLLVSEAPALGEATQSGSGVIIGKVEVRWEEERGRPTPRLDDIGVDIVREETVDGEVLQEWIKTKTSETGVFMATLSNLKGGFRIARLRLPETRSWKNIKRVGIEGDVARYGAVYFRRFGRVVVLNPIIYEEDYDGETRFIMVVGSVADVCSDFLEAFPLSPWRSAVGRARSLSRRAVGSAVEGDEPEAGAGEAALERPDELAGEKRPVAPFLSQEDPEEVSRGTITIIVTLIVVVVLAILVGVGGRRRHRPREREIDIAEIEQIEAEREKQLEEESKEDEEGEEKEEPDHTAVLSVKEGWFLREFRRARVRIHWKKYDSAAVSLEKTTGFMEEHIDRLREKKEVYTLVLHCSYLGRCYLEAGRYNDALRAFKRGIELNEYNSRMCEMGLADTLDAIARSEKSPSAEALGAKYPLLSGSDIDEIMVICRTAEF